MKMWIQLQDLTALCWEVPYVKPKWVKTMFTCLSQMIKNPPANAEHVRDVGSIPGWGRSPGGGQGIPPQCSCLENPMDRGVWWATLHGVTKSWTWLKWLSITHVPLEKTKDHPKQQCNIPTSYMVCWMSKALLPSENKMKYKFMKIEQLKILLDECF